MINFKIKITFISLNLPRQINQNKQHLNSLLQPSVVNVSYYSFVFIYTEIIPFVNVIDDLVDLFDFLFFF